MSNIYPFEGYENQSAIPMDEEELVRMEDIIKLEDRHDGSTVYGIRDESDSLYPQEELPFDFHENLALHLDSGELKALGGKLLREIEEDKDARKEWEQTTNTAYKYLGLKIEEFTNVPFMRACGAIDTTLMKAVLRNFAVARAELFPAAGPAKTEIVGIPTQQSEEEGERVKLFMNHYLTNMDKDYYPDSELLLMYAIFFGSAFRKTYQDPVLNRPMSRAIRPQDLIVNPHATSILSSTRITHVIQLTRKEIILKGLSGDFIKDSIPESPENYSEDVPSIIKSIQKSDGTNPSASENKSLYEYYESHVELDSDDLPFTKEVGRKDKTKTGTLEDLPRPYIVTICKESRKVVSIRRNWEEGDPVCTRLECFTHYYYLKGFGMYGIGLAMLLGSNAVTLTSISRQLIDAGTLKNFPGGLKAKGVKSENNDKAIGPNEFLTIETGDRPIQDTIMLMPYGEPSTVLAALLEKLKAETEELAATAQAEVSEMGTRISEGSALAILEVANTMQSTILRSLHNSLKNELQLLFNLFGKYLPDEPYPFAVPGRNSAIMRQDFNDRVNIVPASDPNVLTTAHRLVINTTLLQMAQANPALHNMKEIYRRVYESMNVDNIEAILPPEQEAIPLDPITENINAMQGKPLKVGLDQDHNSHNISHGAFMQQLQQMLQQGMDVNGAIAALAAHMKEHVSADYLIQMQMMIGHPMPSGEELMNPEVQNMIALQAAQAIMQQQQQIQEQQPQPLDPNAVMMADIEQRREAAYLKEEEAKMKTETEAFKSQLKFESDKARIDAQKSIAQDKNEVDLAIAEMKETRNNRSKTHET